MTGREVATLAFRLMAIYTLLNALWLISSDAPMIQMLGMPSVTSGNLFSATWLVYVLMLASLLATIALANILWIRAERIASRMVPYSPPEASAARMTAWEFQIVGLSLIGVLLLVRAVPGLFQAVWWYFQTPGLGRGSIWRWEAMAAGSAMELAMALLLLLVPRPVARLLGKVRRAPAAEGTAPPAAE
jgi:hypothetical protein